MLGLQQYQFEIQYKPGRIHQDADGLSRQALEKEDVEVDEDVKLVGGGDVEVRPPQQALACLCNVCSIIEQQSLVYLMCHP